MDVLKNSNNQNVVTSSIVGALFLALIIFGGFMIILATRIAGSEGTQVAALGPIKLFELYKTPDPIVGYNAGINFHVGLLIYFCLWFGVGLAVGAIRARKGYVKESY